MSALYFDYQATTPVDPVVRAAMLPYLEDAFGNPSSVHRWGTQAAAAVKRAREQCAAFLSAEPSEIVFTSGATESNNLAIQGVLSACGHAKPHLITTAIEHPSVLEIAEEYGKAGARVTVLPVDSWGRVQPEGLESAIAEDTVLVSIIAANNEIGTLQDLEALGQICRSRGVIFHVDAVQWVPYLELNVRKLPVDLVSFSGHKIYGPKGIGALYVRGLGQPGGVKIRSLFYGGGQEGGLRPGTLPVPGIVGLGAACTEVSNRRLEDAERIQKLAERLWSELKSRIPELVLNGAPMGPHRHIANLNLRFPKGCVTSDAMKSLQDVAFSAGSACSAGAGTPSHVLDAIGVTFKEILTSARFSIGRMTQPDEIDQLVQRLSDYVDQRKTGGSDAKNHISSSQRHV